VSVTDGKTAVDVVLVFDPLKLYWLKKSKTARKIIKSNDV
jgi:hypothetical protein